MFAYSGSKDYPLGPSKFILPKTGSLKQYEKTSTYQDKVIAVDSNGETYEGSCKEGLRNGQGKQTYANGHIYTGEWINDEPNGEGSLVLFEPNYYLTWDEYYCEKITQFKGQWKNGKKNGLGEYYQRPSYERDSLESFYQINGNWQDDLLNGYASVTDSFIWYDGWFKDGLKHGIGKTSENGEITTEIWEAGIRKDALYIFGQGWVKGSYKIGSLTHFQTQDGKYVYINNEPSITFFNGSLQLPNGNCYQFKRGDSIDYNIFEIFKNWFFSRIGLEKKDN